MNVWNIRTPKGCEFGCEHRDGEGDARLNAATAAALQAHTKALASLEASLASAKTTQAEGDAATALQGAQGAAKAACTASQKAIAAERASDHGEGDDGNAAAAGGVLFGNYVRNAEGYEGTIQIGAPDPKDFTKSPTVKHDGSSLGRSSGTLSTR